MKFQLVPIVVAASLALVVVVLRSASRRSPRHLAAIALALPLVFATPIKNAVRHGNPVWPVELHLGGHVLPFLEHAYEQSPPGLASSPRPLRFLHSVLELENRPVASHERWSLDQWAPSDDPSCRMGGYFGAYVVLNLASLAYLVWRRRDRTAKAAAALFAGVTVVASLVPQSHELRYYMHWMLLLVALNLVLWMREGPRARLGVGLVATLAFVVVSWSTGGGYLYASGMSFDTFLSKRVDRAALEGPSAPAPGERVCVDARPFTFLYAAPLHRHRRREWIVQESESDADCRGARRLVP
jgi:hypothetical protein